jgi:predicted nucleic acid-binding protein
VPGAPAGNQAPTLLDASAAIVLFATDHMGEILAAWPGAIGIVKQAREEVLFLRDRSVQEGVRPAERLSFDSLIGAGALSLFTIDVSSEFEIFVRFANALGDGESAAGAVAASRGFALEIDDRRARAVIGSDVTLNWSLEIVKHWTSAANVPPEELKRALLNIRRWASYIPHRSHPLREW